MVPIGYGYRSVEHIIEAALRVEAEPGLAARQAVLKQMDAAGVMATPANSAYNEQVIEAARDSILHGGRVVEIKGLYETVPNER